LVLFLYFFKFLLFTYLYWLIFLIIKIFQLSRKQIWKKKYSYILFIFGPKNTFMILFRILGAKTWKYLSNFRNICICKYLLFSEILNVFYRTIVDIYWHSTYFLIFIYAVILIFIFRYFNIPSKIQYLNWYFGTQNI
jgi:hypothetical protein